MRAKYIIVVATDGINFPKWVAACGANFISLQAFEGGGSVLWIEGTQKAIDTFTADLSYDPVEVA